MGSRKRNRRQGQKRAAAPRPARSPRAAGPERAGFPYRVGVWIAGIVAGALVIALGAWLIDWGKSVGANSGPTLAVIVDVDPMSSNSYALTDPVTSAADRITLLSGTASPEDIMALIMRHGGAPLGSLDATLILEGRWSSLRIIDIQPQILPAKGAPVAAFLSFPTAGSVSVIPVTADLNQPFPVLETGSGPYFNTHEIDLVQGERESFRISFQATKGYYEFNLLVTYVSGGKQYQQTIPGPTNGVFRLAAMAADYHDYGTIYFGISGNQFEVASRSQACRVFPKSRGC